MATVAIVCIARKEHAYIKEFIEIHRKIGINRFYIYDNGLPNDEPLSEFLKSYHDCVIISIRGESLQLYAYNHFVNVILPHTSEEWFAYIDIDEIICPAKHGTIQAFLEEYGHNMSIALNWRLFSSNGHVNKPDGPVVKNFTVSYFHNLVKTLIHRSLLKCPISNVHNINHSCRRLDGQDIGGVHNELDYTDIIRVNHYYCKSWEEYLNKINRGKADMCSKIILEQQFEELFGKKSIDDYAILNILQEEPIKHDPRVDMNKLQILLDKSSFDKAKQYARENNIPVINEV